VALLAPVAEAPIVRPIRFAEHQRVDDAVAVQQTQPTQRLMDVQGVHEHVVPVPPQRRLLSAEAGDVREHRIAVAVKPHERMHQGQHVDDIHALGGGLQECGVRRHEVRPRVH
jgi:uncharacterized protein (DUF2342 family)